MGLSMKIGTIAYATNTGLGYQTKAYVKHFEPEKIMLVNLKSFNGLALNDWYSDQNVIHVDGYPRDEHIIEFLRGLDVVILAETPLNYALYAHARHMKVKTAVVINWEFFDHEVNPQYPLPDLIIMPSQWHYAEAQLFCSRNNIRCAQIHHPVDREEIRFRLRTTRKLMHIAGKPAAHDRNGTWDFLQFVPNGLVTTQSEDLARHIRSRYRHSNVFTDIDNVNDIYNKGDILVLPRRYGGNCLPMNEALASGMPVCMPNIEPNNNILPPEWLYEAKAVDSFTPRTKIDIYSPIANSFKEKLEWFKNCDIKQESEKASDIADSISWKTLKPKYMKVLEDLL